MALGRFLQRYGSLRRAKLCSASRWRHCCSAVLSGSDTWHRPSSGIGSRRGGNALDSGVSEAEDVSAMGLDRSQSVPSPSFLLGSRRWFSAERSSAYAAASPKKDEKKPPPFSKVLVANRGEIACRIIRTARRMGMRTAVVHSDVDADSRHVRMADEAVCVGPAAPALSYLNIDAVLDAIKSTQAEAVHPGYGFLSENAEFARRVEDAGVAFVGPPSAAMAVMGDKVNSKRLASSLGIATIPGSGEPIRDVEHAVEISRKIGFPVILKPAAGGGGKGMRVAWNEDDVTEGFNLCKYEAMSSFGDNRIFIERYLEEPRHVEIQIMADNFGNMIYFPERECSVQRRKQKVVEEAPSTCVDAGLRKAMGEAALRLAQASGYRSAGTVEFLVNKQHDYYFLETNTRLQVEHPVTELITRLDLVNMMFRIAAGEALDVTQERALDLKGWAIESRICAEDPRRGFLPASGRLRHYVRPVPHLRTEVVRVDTGVEEGSEVSIHYDSLLAKLTTWGPDRGSAIASMERALDSYVVRGVTNNIPFLRSVVSHPAFVAGQLSTRFLEDHFPKGWHGEHLTERQKGELCAITALLQMTHKQRASTIGPKAPEPLTPTDLVITLDGQDRQVHAVPVPELWKETFSLEVDMGWMKFNIKGNKKLGRQPWVVDFEIDGKPGSCQIVKRLPRGFRIMYHGAEYDVLVQNPTQASLQQFIKPPPATDHRKKLRSPMPGYLVTVPVKVGQEVAEGDELVVIEAMKMRNVLRAEYTQKIKAIHAKEGDILAVDQIILEFE